MRLSTGARYQGDRFEPARHYEPDAQTVLLLDMDTARGPWLLDRSGRGGHPERVGDVKTAPPPPPQPRSH